MHLGLLLLALPVLAALSPKPAPSLPTPAIPTAAPAEEAKTPESYIPELKALIAQTDPLLGQLRALQERYKEPRAVRGLAPERARLLGQIVEKLGRFAKLEEEFNDLHREQTTASGYQALAQFMGGAMPKNAADIINRSLAHNYFGRETRSWRERAMYTLATEDEAFKLALRAAKFQEILALAVVLLLVFLGVALAFWAKAARAKAKLETDISKLTSSTPFFLGVETPGQAGSGATPAAVVLGGNYVIEREVGRGGMGIVYEATDLSLRRKVAIKNIRREVQEQLQEAELLLSEARLVAKLKHPNIVEIHSIFREKGQIFLVFEFVAGNTLQEVLRQHIRLTLEQAKSVLRQIGAALDYAHRERVIHRDLKPSNVMITAEGVAKVMDFGIAHQAKVTVARMTQSQAWGTPPYMAPEQELGTISRESDLYALGVFLYEMTTGRLPFNGPNFLEQKRTMAFFPPSKACPGMFPAGLDALLAKALQAEPAARFHSAQDMVAALEAL